MNSVSKRTFNLVLGGIMVAMATVLGFIKVYEIGRASCRERV